MISFETMLKLMPKAFQRSWKKNMQQDSKITRYRNSDLFLQHNEKCQSCWRFFKVLEARQCSNGFFSWRCESCWKERESENAKYLKGAIHRP